MITFFANDNVISRQIQTVSLKQLLLIFLILTKRLHAKS